jgi:hypothetical protein
MTNQKQRFHGNRFDKNNLNTKTKTMNKNQQQIQFGSAVLLLLQREFIRECKIEPAMDENGIQQTDESGQPMDRAVHPLGLNFESWLIQNKLIIEQSTIIQPNNNIKIVKS